MCACECVVSGCILVCNCRTSKQVPLPASFGSKLSTMFLLIGVSTNAVKS